MVAVFEESSDPWELQKGLIGTGNNISNDDISSLVSIGHVMIEDSTPEERIKIISNVYAIFNDDFGHLLDHYCMNIYYILKFIDNSENASEYSKIFRSQLSRHELTAIYYFLFSGLSSVKFIKLVIKYDILNAIFWADICYYPNYEKRVLDLNCILQDKLTRT